MGLHARLDLTVEGHVTPWVHRALHVLRLRVLHDHDAGRANAAICTALQGVCSQPVPVALVGECSIPVVWNVACQPRSSYCVAAILTWPHCCRRAGGSD